MEVFGSSSSFLFLSFLLSFLVSFLTSVHELTLPISNPPLLSLMFNDKPPCMPFCFGNVDYTARGGRGFSSFLASTAATFCSSSFFLSFFFAFLFPPVLVLSVFSFSSSSRSFSSIFSSFFDSVFSPAGLCNCLRLSFLPGWVM